MLHEGYAREGSGGERVGSSVTLIMDADRVIVVDPGMVSGRDALLSAVAGHGPGPDDVTDVVFSHHHPDHTVNAALFPAARIHDHWAIYAGDRWIDRDAEGFELGPSVRLLRTPGHTAEDISTVASTADDVFVCTHAWWMAEGPADAAEAGKARHPAYTPRSLGELLRAVAAREFLEATGAADRVQAFLVLNILPPECFALTLWNLVQGSP